MVIDLGVNRKLTCDFLFRAGLIIWWALRTPQHRGPTGKLDAEEEEVWEGVPLPSQLWVMENVV